MKTEQRKLYDVVSVNISDGKVEDIYAERKTIENAEAIIEMAVMRRGVEAQFYADVPTGKFKIGDIYKSED